VGAEWGKTEKDLIVTGGWKVVIEAAGTMGALIAERSDAYMRHCVAGVTKGGKGKARAFAICKAGGNKAGYYKPGTKQQTAKGKKAIRAHGRDAAAKTKDAAYARAIKGEGTMTQMRALIEAAGAAWGTAGKRAFAQAAEAQLAKQGQRFQIRGSVSTTAVSADVQVKGAVHGDAGVLVIEVGRVKTAQGSVREAGAQFIPAQGRPYWLVDGKAVPQSKAAGWPPEPRACGAEVGDMLAQVYEMALGEGFVAEG
jgi:hypothetical protein